MIDSTAAILEDLKNPQDDNLEPGLLSVFRLVTGLELVLMLMVLVGAVLGRDIRPGWVLGAGIVWLLVLLLYLSWPRLHRRMGRWYLPPALVFAGLVPLLDQTNLLRTSVLDSAVSVPYDSVTGSGWRMLVFVLFPVAMTAWQYGMAQVLLFALCITGASVVQRGWIFGWTSPFTISAIPFTVGQGILLILVGYVVVRMITVQREHRAQLFAANKKLADYAATVDQLATSRERNRLARELHDTLSHTLSSLAVQLEAVESVWRDAPDQAHALLIKAIANTRGGLAETRRALQALRSSPLEDLGLGLALRNLAESTAKRDGLKLVKDIPSQVEGLVPAVEQCIYRVAQEALENVARHAQASTIRVALAQQDDGRWQLLVQDDGQGFDPATGIGDGRYGLQGMQERAAMVGGRLDLSSQPGSGTQIRLEVGQVVSNEEVE